MKTTKSAVTFGGFHPSFKTGFKTVELRQEITTTYDKVKLSSNMEDSLYLPDEIDTEGEEYTSVRVAFREVEKGLKEADVKKMISRFPDATLYRVMSHAVILDEGQEQVYKNGLTGDKFKDFVEKHNLKSTAWDKACQKALVNSIAASQLVVYGENNTEGKDADEAVLYNGQKQYRQVYFSQTHREDVDLRNEVAVSEAIDMAPNTANVKHTIGIEAEEEA